MIMGDTRFLLDARWAGHGGIGRVTSQLAEGMGLRQPPGDWTVWNRDPDLVWDGARSVTTDRPPAAWTGQREILNVPSCDVAIFPANLRPLRKVGRRSLTMIYDTIPLRFATNRKRATVARAVFTAAAHLSTRVLTISEFSADCIARDLGYDRSRIVVVPIPLEQSFARTVRPTRPERLADRPTVVFVGRFAPHKNLHRLVEAFTRSNAAANGAELILAGGVGPEIDRLRRYARSIGASHVRVQGQVSEPELLDLYAKAWVLAFPSLEEGLGLPVLEATAAGVPILASNGGAISEVVGERFPLVDPYDVAAMSQRLDELVAVEGIVPTELVAWAENRPSVVDLADAVIDQAGIVAARR